MSKFDNLQFDNTFKVNLWLEKVKAVWLNTLDIDWDNVDSVTKDEINQITTHLYRVYVHSADILTQLESELGE
jgi:hypothetical protein